MTNLQPNPDEKFVGIQVSPISFIDEGVDVVLDTLQNRIGVNVLMLGTVSWLGLKLDVALRTPLMAGQTTAYPSHSP